MKNTKLFNTDSGRWAVEARRDSLSSWVIVELISTRSLAAEFARDLDGDDAKRIEYIEDTLSKTNDVS